VGGGGGVVVEVVGVLSEQIASDVGPEDGKPSALDRTLRCSSPHISNRMLVAPISAASGPLLVVLCREAG
jgi:hypothetical protein